MHVPVIRQKVSRVMNHLGAVPLCSLLAAFIAMLVTPACAQAWIGQMAGEMAGQRAQAAQENACLHGAPAEPREVQDAKDGMEKTMTAYFGLTSHATARELRNVFALDKPGVTWRNAGGIVPISKIGPDLDAPTPERKLVALVVGGDAKAARASWSTDRSGRFYAGDFVDEGWFGGWKIWHMAVLPVQPDVPPAYCHFDPAQGF